MPVLNTADKVMVGATQADRVYLGTELVWEPAPVGPPLVEYLFDGETDGSDVASGNGITVFGGAPKYTADGFDDSAVRLLEADYLNLDVPTPEPILRVEAEDFSDSQGVSTQPAQDTGGGLNLRDISDGDWTLYRDLALGFEPDAVSFRVASDATITGQIEVRAGSTTGTLLGSAPVSSTGGWQTWQTVTAELTGAAAGVQDIALVFTSEQGDNFVNLNWFELSGQATTPALSGSVFARLEGAPASGVIRGVFLLNRLNGWLSIVRFRSSGEVQVTKATTLEGDIGTWVPGDEFRFDWQYDNAGNCDWRMFKGANIYGTVPDGSVSVTGIDLGGDSLVAATVGLNRSGSPAGSSVVYDTVRLSSDLTWITP